MSSKSVMPFNHFILLSPAPPALNLSQHQRLFQWVRSFPMSWLLESRGQSIGASASASVLSMYIQGWFPLGLTDLIFLQSKGLLWIFSSTTVWKNQFLSNQPSLWSKFHICMWILEKPVVTGFYLLLSFGTCSSVVSFCLSCYFYFYVSGNLVTFPSLREVTFCRGCPICYSNTLPSSQLSCML